MGESNKWLAKMKCDHDACSAIFYTYFPEECHTCPFCLSTVTRIDEESEYYVECKD